MSDCIWLQVTQRALESAAIGAAEDHHQAAVVAENRSLCVARGCLTHCLLLPWTNKSAFSSPVIFQRFSF